MSKSLHQMPESWQGRLGELLPLYGHRNWIVVADAAYPAQSRPGLETITTAADQIDVVGKVWQAIGACRHIAATVYTDAELGLVAENDAPGIGAYRLQIDSLFSGAKRKQLLHQEIITQLDQAAQMFSILILKTCMTIPYTSVFFELNCGYWNEAAEARLRSRMKAAQSG